MTLNAKLFLTVWIVGTLGAAAGLPYVFDLYRTAAQELAIPLPSLMRVLMFQNGIFLAAIVALGLYLARRVGFATPIFEALLSHRTTSVDWKSFVALPAAVGFVTALIIALTDLLFAYAGVALDAADVTAIPLWKRFLASLYGGMSEEIIMRLFLMSLFVWLFAKMANESEPLSQSKLVWAAILASAMLFGIWHLPATAALVALTPPTVTRCIVLNGFAGVLFGWLYWKRGLEAAMVAHFIADLTILILIPMGLG